MAVWFYVINIFKWVFDTVFLKLYKKYDWWIQIFWELLESWVLKIWTGFLKDNWNTRCETKQYFRYI